MVTMPVAGYAQATPPAAGEIAALIARLDQRDSQSRLQAIRALRRLRARQASRPLRVLAQTDPNEAVRRAAAAAVRAIDPRGYVATLATSDPPPVVRPQRAPAGDKPRRNALLLSAAALFNAKRATKTGGGALGIGLRWPLVDVQVSVTLAALGLFGQLRLNLPLPSPVIPYLTAGLAVAYNVGDAQGREPAMAAVAGGGLRLSLTQRWYLFGEVLGSWVLMQRTPPSTPRRQFAAREFALPLLVGAGVELWP